MSLKGNYIGASIGKSMADVGEQMYRQTARDDEREEDRAFRAEQYDLNREQRVLDREARESDDKPALTDDQTNELVAGNLNISVPEVAAHRNAVRTGDESQFKLDEYPEGITPETIQAKRKAIYALLEQYGTGKDYKPLEEGRSEAHKRGLVDKAIAEPESAPRIAQGAAAGAGKGAYGGNSDVVRNEFTGEVTTTDVGRARINSLNADSSLDAAKVSEIEEKIRTGTVSKEDSDRLTTIIEKANSTLKQLADNPPGRDKGARAEWDAQKKQWEELRERTRRILSSKLEDREKPPVTPKPSKPSGTTSKKDYRSLWQKPGA